MKITNQTHSLTELFETSVFSIPPYQRAYAWQKEHLEAFLSDLRDYQQLNGARKYFLGTLLLRFLDNDGNIDRYEIVDGQQRLTTVCIFISVALQVYPAEENQALSMDRHTFLECSKSGYLRLRTIPEDAPLLDRLLSQQPVTSSLIDTLSQRRLWEAHQFFTKQLDPDMASRLLATLRDAQVLVYCVDSDAAATQIFELQNDRGKRLTDLESVKSFLMHRIYLDSRDPHRDLVIIQENFSKIFRLLEKLEGMHNAPKEDAVLTYHCLAYLPWRERIWGGLPLLIKDQANALTQADRVQWIKNFAGSLAESFQAVFGMLNSRDHYTPIAHLSVLGRFGAFWPTFIKAFRNDASPDKQQFLQVATAAERFLFQALVAGKRADTGGAEIERAARDFQNGFDGLIQLVQNMSLGWDIPRLFQLGLDSPYFYHSGAARYLLWRYENDLRTRIGNQWSLISWSDMVSPIRSAQEYTVDHIAPQESQDNDRPTRWDPQKEAEDRRPFREIYLHRLGNLVLDSRSAGANKGNKPFDQRNYSNSTLLSQQELLHLFATRNAPAPPVWDETAIRQRQKALEKWALNTWP